MTSTIATLRPTAVGFDGPNGWQDNSGGATGVTFASILSLDNDANWLVPPAGNTQAMELTMNMAGFTVPALAQLQWVRVRARIKSTTAPAQSAYIRDYGEIGWPEWNRDTIGGGTPATIATLSGPQWTTKTQDVKGPYVPGDFIGGSGIPGGPGVAVALWPAISGDLLLYGLYLDVAYNQAPVVVSTGPTGIITATSTPTLTHTYSDPENDLQERYHRKVFLSPTGGWPTWFDPEATYTVAPGPPGVDPSLVWSSDRPVWDSGEVFSTSLQDVVPIPLANGIYRHYIKVADAGSAGRYSNWSHSDFSQNVPGPPLAPTLIATPDVANARMVLTLRAASGGGTMTLTFHLQRSEDSGQTWIDTRGVGNPTIPNPQGFGGSFMVYDREARRECQLFYRLRAAGTVGGQTFQGDWVTVPTRLPSDGNEWLRSSSTLAFDMAVVRQGPDLGSVSVEDQATYWPEGRTAAVVVGGTIHDADFSGSVSLRGTGGTSTTGLSLVFQNDADFGRFVALRNNREPILFQTLYGDNVSGLEQFWIRLGPKMEVMRWGGNARFDADPQVREVGITAAVVARPTTPPITQYWILAHPHWGILGETTMLQ